MSKYRGERALRTSLPDGRLIPFIFTLLQLDSSWKVFPPELANVVLCRRFNSFNKLN